MKVADTALGGVVGGPGFQCVLGWTTQRLLPSAPAAADLSESRKGRGPRFGEVRDPAPVIGVTASPQQRLAALHLLFGRCGASRGYG